MPKTDPNNRRTVPSARNLTGCVAAVTAAAVAGTVATDPDDDWYTTLSKPSWQPPPVAFPVVWTALYADIAGVTASALTTLDDADDAAGARRLRAALGVNLVLNAAWSVTFFASQRPRTAVGVAAALAVSSVDLTRRVGQAGPRRTLALAPYPAWCAFATALNLAIVARNR